METETKVEIRWLIRRDLARVIQIDRLMNAEPWGEENFLVFLRQRNCIGMVAEHRTIDGDKTVGFTIYELLKDKLVVLRLAVDPQHRRTGVGRAMLTRLRSKLALQRRKEIWIEVPEDNLGAHLWLRACGAKCVEIIHSAACEEDLYRFVLGLPRDEVTQ